MRKELEFPQIDDSKLELVKELIDKIAENSDETNSPELEKLNSITGKQHSKMEFAEYWGWTDLEELALLTLTPQPPMIRDLTKSEAIKIVNVIKDSLINAEDNKADYYMELLHKSLSVTNVTDYVLGGRDAEEIVDNLFKASAKAVIIL